MKLTCLINTIPQPYTTPHTLYPIPTLMSLDPCVLLLHQHTHTHTYAHTHTYTLHVHAEIHGISTTSHILLVGLIIFFLVKEEGANVLVTPPVFPT